MLTWSAHLRVQYVRPAWLYEARETAANQTRRRTCCTLADGHDHEHHEEQLQTRELQQHRRVPVEATEGQDEQHMEHHCCCHCNSCPEGDAESPGKRQKKSRIQPNGMSLMHICLAGIASQFLSMCHTHRARIVTHFMSAALAEVLPKTERRSFTALRLLAATAASAEIPPPVLLAVVGANAGAAAATVRKSQWGGWLTPTFD